MSNKKETQKVPSWFKGIVLKESEVITNPNTGESIELTPIEVAIHDFTMGSNIIAETLDSKWLNSMKQEDLNPKAEGFWQNVRNGIGWFREHNAKAYMVLLD